MPLDKQLYQRARVIFQKWNESCIRDQIEVSPERTWQDSWKEFIDLWMFGQLFNLHPNKWESEQKIDSLLSYYKNIHQLEKWRRSRGYCFDKNSTTGC